MSLSHCFTHLLSISILDYTKLAPIRHQYWYCKLLAALKLTESASMTDDSRLCCLPSKRVSAVKDLPSAFFKPALLHGLQFTATAASKLFSLSSDSSLSV